MWKTIWPLFLTAQRPSSLGHPLKLESIFVFYTKLSTSLLLLVSLSQLFCTRTLCFYFPVSEIWPNSAMLLFPICYSIIIIRTSDICIIWWCQWQKGEPTGLSGSICDLLAIRPKSTTSPHLCGPVPQGSIQDASDQISRSVVFDSLPPHELQHRHTYIVRTLAIEQLTDTTWN